MKQLKSLDGGKSTGEDQIPPRLVLLAADELALPLTNAINSSIRNYRFPNNGKRTAVCPFIFISFLNIYTGYKISVKDNCFTN